jgi:hypothetical protein
MKALIVALFAAFALLGCIHQPPNTTVEARKYEDGSLQSETVVRVFQIEETSDVSGITIHTNGLIETRLSGAQDFSEIRKAEGIAAGKKIAYGCIGLLVLMSGAALFLPDRIVTNSDALLGFAGSGGMYAAMTWANASAGIMGIVSPVVVIGLIGYAVWRNRSRIKSDA